jgi:predicted RNA-binding Zn-ribbon protein involved in translation (DUF1610 family)
MEKTTNAAKQKQSIPVVRASAPYAVACADCGGRGPHTGPGHAYRMAIPVFVDRCPKCAQPVHASESNDEGVCPACVRLSFKRCDACGERNATVREFDGGWLACDECKPSEPVRPDYSAIVATRDQARAELMRICTPLSGGYCCVQLVPNDGRPGGARCHEHNAWAATWLGFATALDREHAVRLLRGQGFNYFVFFRDSNFEYALQYGFATWVAPGGISVQL